MTTKLQKLQDEIAEATEFFNEGVKSFEEDELYGEELQEHCFNEGFMAGLHHAMRILLDSRYN